MKQKIKNSEFVIGEFKTFIEVFDNILGSVREPLMVLDADLKVVKANYAFYQTFNVKPGETEGTLIYDLGNGQWNILGLRELLEHILPENTVFNDFEVEHDFETIGRKIMFLNARRIYKKSNQTQLILLAIEDLTEREYYKRHLEKIVDKRTAELRITPSSTTGIAEIWAQGRLQHPKYRSQNSYWRLSDSAGRDDS